MGADMLVAYVDFPKDVNLKEREVDLLKFVETMTEDMIQSTSEDVFYETTEDFEETRKEIANIVKEGFEALHSRRSTWITVDDKIIYLSGGLSWGDAPTEAYEKIGRLGYMMDYQSLR